VAEAAINKSNPRMKHYLLSVAVFLLSACANSEQKIPVELVGIWANDGAVLEDGKWLTSGQALYLGADGSGAMVGGPPPIGIKIAATFDPHKNTLAIERGAVFAREQATYDRNAKTISIGSAKPVPLTRRSEIYDSNIKSTLGL
jgi:hypothetical protein